MAPKTSTCHTKTIGGACVYACVRERSEVCAVCREGRESSGIEDIGMSHEDERGCECVCMCVYVCARMRERSEVCMYVEREGPSSGTENIGMSHEVAGSPQPVYFIQNPTIPTR